jgi:two-component system chemotaxis response regulator CheY
MSDRGIVITAWNMPNMNGLEFVKKVRAVNKKIPIIMVTTEGGKKEVIMALKAGVNNYIVKPFDKKTLKEKLEAI